MENVCTDVRELRLNGICYMLDFFFKMTQQMSNLNITSSQSQPSSSQQANLGSWPPQPSTTVSMKTRHSFV